MFSWLDLPTPSIASMWVTSQLRVTSCTRHFLIHFGYSSTFRKPHTSHDLKHPSWRNWLARQTVNLEAVSSILTEGEAIRTRTQSGLLYFWRASLYSCPSDGFAAGLDFWSP